MFDWYEYRFGIKMNGRNGKKDFQPDFHFFCYMRFKKT